MIMTMVMMMMMIITVRISQASANVDSGYVSSFADGSKRMNFWKRKSESRKELPV